MRYKRAPRSQLRAPAWTNFPNRGRRRGFHPPGGGDKWVPLRPVSGERGTLRRWFLRGQGIRRDTCIKRKGAGGFGHARGFAQVHFILTRATGSTVLPDLEIGKRSPVFMQAEQLARALPHSDTAGARCRPSPHPCPHPHPHQRPWFPKSSLCACLTTRYPNT